MLEKLHVVKINVARGMKAAALIPKMGPSVVKMKTPFAALLDLMVFPRDAVRDGSFYTSHSLITCYMCLSFLL